MNDHIVMKENGAGLWLHPTLSVKKVKKKLPKLL